MYRKIIQWRGVEYTKWVDKSTNYVDYNVSWDYKLYHFDNLKDTHDFIKAHFTLV